MPACSCKAGASCTGSCPAFKPNPVSATWISATACCGWIIRRGIDGHPKMISPRSEVLADAGESEGVVGAKLDLPELQTYRQKFPVLDDLR